MEVQPQLAAMAEPTRFRIIELLSTRACTVGEVAQHLDALQPQTTKHIQALERAGVIRVHKLGRRRVARLDRDSMSALSAFFAGLSVPAGDDAVLDDYEAAIAREGARSLDNDARVLDFERQLPASVADVWAAWTDPERAVLWWAPRHFEVDVWEFAPQEGAPIRFVLREGDATTYESAGTVDEVEPGGGLAFRLAPLGSDGEPLFTARHTMTLTAAAAATVLRLRIEVSGVRSEAAPAVAGLEPGWTQLLDNLGRRLESGFLPDNIDGPSLHNETA